MAARKKEEKEGRRTSIPLSLSLFLQEQSASGRESSDIFISFGSL
jgi:hypothetical protein